MKSDNRLNYVDVAKGLGMLAVIWGHTRLSGWSFSFVYAWHMPLFFFLSGQVFDRQRYGSFTSFLRKKWHSLLLPYIFYSFITWAMWAVVMKAIGMPVASYWMPLMETFISRAPSGYFVHNVPLWFVLCLFSMETLYYFLSCLRVWARIAISVVMAISGYLLIEHVTAVDLTLTPWSLDVVCLAMIWFVLGNILMETVGYIRVNQWVTEHKGLVGGMVTVCLALVLLISQYNGRISYAHSDLGRDALASYAGSLLGVGAVVALSVLSCAGKWADNISLRYVKWVGKNSFRFMVLHEMVKYLVLAIVSVVAKKGITDLAYLPGWSLLTYGCTLVLLSGIVLLIERQVNKRKVAA